MALPLDKAARAAIGPIVRRLWQDLVKVPPGAGIANKPTRSDPRIPFSGLRKELENAQIARITHKLATRSEELRNAEFPSASDGEVAAAILAVGDAFARTAPLDISKIFDLNLDPVRLTKLVAAHPTNAQRRNRMGDAEGQLYDLLLHATAVHVIEFFTSRPEFLLRAQVENARRAGLQQDALDRMTAVLSALAGGDSQFERQYCATIAAQLNKVQFYGLNRRDYGRDPVRSHALDTAYVPLRVSPLRSSSYPDLAARVGGQPVDEALSSHARIVLTGSAGSGKTTTLQWLALAAIGALGEDANTGAVLVPFFLPLRHIVKRGSFPRPEEFVDVVAPMLAGSMPQGWVHDCLRTGRALVLIDGVDEVPRNQRHEAMEWVRQLVEQWGRARYVVTSRPAALGLGWQDMEGFSFFEILPMTPMEAATLIRRWQATISSYLDYESRLGLDNLESRLHLSPDLAVLLRNPALCALAARATVFHYHGHADNRLLDLCRASVRLLTGTREATRDLGPVEGVSLEYAQRVRVLGSLAWWMTRNDLDSIDYDELLVRMHGIVRGPLENRDPEYIEDVVQYLLVRSGLINVDEHGEVAFSNNVIRDYLSAEFALSAGDEAFLVRFAQDGLWDEVVIFGIAIQLDDGDQSSLAEALVERAKSHPGAASDLLRLVGAGVAGAGERQYGMRVLRSLLPVRGVEEAHNLAACGSALLPLLAQHDVSDESAAAGIARTAVLIGGEAALSVIGRFSSDARPSVVNELVSGWSRFDTENYARTILADAALEEVTVCIDDISYLPLLRHLRRLRRLGCTRVFNDAAAFEEVLDRLEELTFEHCPELRNLGPLSEAGLQRLVIRDCPVDLTTIDPSVSVALSLAYSDVVPKIEALTPAVTLTDLTVKPTAGRLDLTTLRPHTGLQRLSAAGWPSPAEFAVLESLPDLRELHIAAAMIDDFAPLERLLNLERLNISFYMAPPDANALVRMPNLVDLRLEYLGFGPLPFPIPEIDARIVILSD